MPQARKTAQKAKRRTQYGALPYAVRDGLPQVMLITSRDTGRWIIPKGWPEKKVSPPDLAAREAYEEAGLVGRPKQQPVGQYRYEKRLKSGKCATCDVDVFLLQVERELDEWPEKGQRERRWMTPAQAALLVSEAGLVDLLLNLAGPLDHMGP